MKGICGLLLFVGAMIMPACALEVPGTEGLWQAAEAYGIPADTGLEDGLLRLLSGALELGQQLAKTSLATGARLMAVVLLCSLAENMQVEEKRGGLQAVELAGALSVTALTMTDIAAMIGLGREAVGQMDLFSQTLLPVLTVLTAASGGISSAAMRQAATVLFSQILIMVMDRLLIPLVYAYVAVSCVQAATGRAGLKKISGMVKGMVTFLLTAILLSFVGYLSASGAIAGSVDMSKIKAARMAISRAVPVVGGILADASESLLVGAGILKSTVGVVGALVVLAICLTPFLHLALHYLTYKATAGLCALVAQPRLSQLIDAIGSAFGLVLGMTGAAALLLLVSLVSAVSVTIS